MIMLTFIVTAASIVIASVMGWWCLLFVFAACLVLAFFRNTVKWKVLLLFIVFVVSVFYTCALKSYQIDQLKSLERISHNVLLTVKVVKKLKSGYIVRLKGVKSIPSRRFSCNGILSGRLGENTYDPGDYLVVKGKISFPGSVSPYRIPVFKLYCHKVISSQKGFFHFIHDFKRKLIAKIRLLLPEFFAGFLIGLLIGTNGIPLNPELLRVFRDLGMLHAIVVSGAQVALITTVFLSVLKLFPLPRWIVFLLVVILNSLFLILVGSDLSVLRAVIMMVISLFLTFDYRLKEGRDVLFLSAIAILLLNPYYLFELSFILSFSATFALIEISPSISRFFEKWFPDSPLICSMLSVSIAPLLLTAPVILFVFHRFDFLSLAANLILGSIIEVIVLIGFLAISFLIYIPVINILIFKFLLGLMVFVVTISHLLYKIPHTQFVDQVSLVGIIVYYGGLLWCRYVGCRLREILGFGIVAGFLIFISWRGDELFFYQNGSTFFNACRLNRCVVVYASKLNGRNKHELVSFLKEINVYNIDYLIVSGHLKEDIRSFLEERICFRQELSPENVVIIETRNQHIRLTYRSQELVIEGGNVVLFSSGKVLDRLKRESFHGVVVRVIKRDGEIILMKI